MAVTRDEVRRVAALARLDLSNDEVESMARELSAILGHVEALADVAVEGAAPGAPREAALRVDEPGADPLAEPPAGFAPELRDGLFVVPRSASHEAGEAADAE